MKRTIVILYMTLCCLLLTACGAKVTALHVELPENMVAGESVEAKLTADYDKPDAADEDKAKALEALGVQWSSSDEAVATVDAQGKVTAVDGGTTTISAIGGGKDGKDDSKQSVTAEITVTVPLEGVDAPKTLALMINKTDSEALDAKPMPENATTDGKYTYKSSDEEIATVDASGKVTAVANGEAVVTTTLDGKTAETKVTVKTGATGIRLEQGKGGTITVGGGVKLVARTEPAEAEASTYTYASDNTKIATVNADGTVAGVSLGTANITVKSADGHTAAYTVTVAVKCGYCGQFGHNATNCPVKKDAEAKKQKKTPATGKGATGGGGEGSAPASGNGSVPSTTTPTPTPAPTPTEPQHYHGNGSDSGACPVCGAGYSPAVGVGNETDDQGPLD